eukprot:1324857-Amphidinium_carterae.1
MYHAELQTRLVPVPTAVHQPLGSAASAPSPPAASNQKKRPAPQQGGRPGKSKGNGKSPRMPEALKAGVPNLPDGTPICF